MSLEFKTISTLDVRRKNYFWMVLLAVLLLCWKAYHWEFKVKTSTAESTERHVASEAPFININLMPAMPPAPEGYEVGPEMVTGDLLDWLNDLVIAEE
ncbi:MAG: hypothetical protein AAF598_01990 [Bacteroidota bacterium]